MRGGRRLTSPNKQNRSGPRGTTSEERHIRQKRKERRVKKGEEEMSRRA